MGVRPINLKLRSGMSWKNARTDGVVRHGFLRPADRRPRTLVRLDLLRKRQYGGSLGTAFILNRIVIFVDSNEVVHLAAGNVI